MRELLSVLIVLQLVAGCEKEEVSKGTPECIEEKIDVLANAPVANPPAKVYSYQYKGKTVYYIPPKCCDIPGELYDADCNFICSPDGGITGKGDGRCPDFFELRTEEKLVWADPRKR